MFVFKSLTVDMGGYPSRAEALLGFLLGANSERIRLTAEEYREYIVVRSGVPNKAAARKQYAIEQALEHLLYSLERFQAAGALRYEQEQGVYVVELGKWRDELTNADLRRVGVKK